MPSRAKFCTLNYDSNLEKNKDRDILLYTIQVKPKITPFTLSGIEIRSMILLYVHKKGVSCSQQALTMTSL